MSRALVPTPTPPWPRTVSDPGYPVIEARELTSDTFEALLDLLRRLPPTRAEANIEALCALAPDHADDLLANVDQPLKILHDEASGKDFLGCDYNRDGDSFRSPWTDEYIPPAPGAPQPSPRLRQLEVQLNTAFETYREMYFEGGTSSVYLWDLDEDPAAKDMQFAGVVLMKKCECRFLCRLYAPLCTDMAAGERTADPQRFLAARPPAPGTHCTCLSAPSAAGKPSIS